MGAQSRPVNGNGVLKMNEEEIRELIHALRDWETDDKELEELLRKAANALSDTVD